MPRYIEKIENITLPVLPLRGLVAFPSIPVSFDVEREVSLKAIKNAQKNNNLILLVTQKDISVKLPTKDDLFTVGTIATIKQTMKTQEGFTRVVAEGSCRAEILDISINKNNEMTATCLSKVVSNVGTELDLKTEALMRKTDEQFEQMISFLPSISDEMILTSKSLKNPGLYSDFLASIALVKFDDKQKILNEFRPYERLEKLSTIFDNELEILNLENKISKKVKRSMDENQREYYLREQLKAIQVELGYDANDDCDSYFQKIDKSNIPDEIKEKLKKEVSRLSKTPFGSPDASVLRNYIETCLSIPWNKSTKDVVNIEVAKKTLNNDHDGLDKVKNRILEYIAVKQLSPDIKNQIICLVGPPGVGKTSIGASIAKAMNRKYVRVSLGGVRDEADIRGHRKTYIGAMPGRIIESLIKAGTNNPVMLLDEIDKLCSDAHGDPASALLEVLDPEQNKFFVDHFIEEPVDLSNVLFIATANTLDTVPRPLIDRMEVIYVDSYTTDEKIIIAQNHLIKKQLKRHGLTKSQLSISKDALLEIIKSYTRESGVRSLERNIASLCRKAAKYLIENNKKQLRITAKNIETFLGPKIFIEDEKETEDLCGVVNGLAYTESGGDLLKIEATIMDGSGKLELTGSLGEVMKESAQIAVSYIRAHSSELNIDSDFYKNKDIHIHVPEGAVPKDGPSAGVTMLTALVSSLTGRNVDHNYAMTGEITLTGRVLPIGGLREKSSAALSAGVKNVLIPKENLRDIVELPDAIKNSINFIPCNKVSQVIKYAIL